MLGIWHRGVLFGDNRLAAITTPATLAGSATPLGHLSNERVELFLADRAVSIGVGPLDHALGHAGPTPRTRFKRVA